MSVSDIPECASNPCLNGATCTDLVNGYECTCPAGYRGTNCQIGRCGLVKYGLKNGGGNPAVGSSSSSCAVNSSLMEAEPGSCHRIVLKRCCFKPATENLMVTG